MQILTKIVMLAIIICCLYSVSGENLTNYINNCSDSLNVYINLTNNNSKLENEITQLNNNISETENNISRMENDIADTKKNISSANKTINELNLKTEKLNKLKDNAILTTAIGVIPSLMIGLSIATLIGFVLLVNRWKR